MNIKNINIRLDDNEYLALVRLCKRFKLNHADMIRHIVKEVLKANKED